MYRNKRKVILGRTRPVLLLRRCNPHHASDPQEGQDRPSRPFIPNANMSLAEEAIRRTPFRSPSTFPSSKGLICESSECEATSPEMQNLPERKKSGRNHQRGLLAHPPFHTKRDYNATRPHPIDKDSHKKEAPAKRR